MKITLNNRDEVFKGLAEMSVEKLLKLKNFTFPMIIIRINGELVKKHEYPAAMIKDGDKVTALHLISGG